MARIKVITYPNCYQLQVGLEKSPPAAYGEFIELEAMGRTYAALWSIGDNGKPEPATQLKAWMMTDSGVDVVTESADPAEFDGVDPDDLDEDDEDDDDDDDDGEDVDIDVDDEEDEDEGDDDEDENDEAFDKSKPTPKALVAA